MKISQKILSASGLALVAAGALWLVLPTAGSRSPAATGVASAASPATQPTMRSVLANSQAPDARLARRLAVVENALLAQQASSAATFEEPSAKEIEQQHEMRIAEHSRERINSTWASSTASMLREDLEMKSVPASYEVEEVDCRSTSCVVSLKWSSRGTAASEWQSALQQPSRVPCARQIVVPEAVGADGDPVVVSLVIDCSTWVERGSPVEPIPE